MNNFTLETAREILADGGECMMRNGDPAVICVISENESQLYRIFGYIKNSDGHLSSGSWDSNGMFLSSEDEQPFDLLAPRKMVSEYWVNQYQDYLAGASNSKSTADRIKLIGRIRAIGIIAYSDGSFEVIEA